MSESNNVKFVESNGKWLWKRYDEQGSVIFKSPEFDTERLAREDYDINGGEAETSTDTSPEAGPAGRVTATPTESADAGNVVPQGGNDAGSASPDVDQSANTI